MNCRICPAFCRTSIVLFSNLRMRYLTCSMFQIQFDINNIRMNVPIPPTFNLEPAVQLGLGNKVRSPMSPMYTSAYCSLDITLSAIFTGSS